MIKTLTSTATHLALAPARLTARVAAALLHELRGDDTPDARRTRPQKTAGARRPATARPKRSTASRPNGQPRQKATRTRAKPQPKRPVSAPASGFPEGPSATDQHGDRSSDPSPHHALNNPIGEPDPTEWPDPYEHREDPRDPSDPGGPVPGYESHAPTGATSTSQPHPSQDLEAEPTEGPKRDRIDD